MAERQCGACTLCCKVLGNAELNKPLGDWCTHCLPGQGCAIYADRPHECRKFTCAWLGDDNLGEEWYPKKSKIVLTYESDRIVAHVDPGTPDAWRKQPYFTVLNQMMQDGLANGRLVYAAINEHHILLLPDRQEDLGVLAGQDEVALAVVRKGAGLEYQVTVRRSGSEQQG
jgi:hypothetical protein